MKLREIVCNLGKNLVRTAKQTFEDKKRIREYFYLLKANSSYQKKAEIRERELYYLLSTPAQFIARIIGKELWNIEKDSALIMTDKPYLLNCL